MEDAKIIELYWARDEDAIGQTRAKYGAYCMSIARSVLASRQDVEECVNDTYLGAWNAMPPQRPDCLPAFLGKIARNLSLKRWRSLSAVKRGGGEVALSLDELADCTSTCGDVGERLEAAELAHAIDEFLATLSDEQRRMFMRRYWYFDSVGDIARRFGCGQSKVKMTLKRTRDGLAAYLSEKGVCV